MSVEIPVFEYKTRTADSNDIYSYGFAFTSADLDDAVSVLVRSSSGYAASWRRSKNPVS